MHNFLGLRQLGRGWGAGVGPLWEAPRTLDPRTGQLCPELTSTFLLLSHGTLRPTGGGSALVAVDGGVGARPGCPPACTCATWASLRTAHYCRSPGVRPRGCPPEELCAACTWPPPAFSPASRGLSGMPSRRPWGPRQASPGWLGGQAATDPGVLAEGPLSLS